MRISTLHRVAVRAHSPATLLLAAFQLLHWFDPSQPYLVQVLHTRIGMPADMVYSSIFPWATFAMLPMCLLASVVFEVLGPAYALLLASASNGVSLLLLLLRLFPLQHMPPGSSADMLLRGSEVAWALAFSTTFLVVAALYRSLPVEAYPSAAGLTRCMSLLGTISSSFLGYMLVHWAAQGLSCTLWTAAAFRVAELLLLLVGIARGTLSAAPGARWQQPRTPATAAVAAAAAPPAPAAANAAASGASGSCRPLPMSRHPLQQSWLSLSPLRPAPTFALSFAWYSCTLATHTLAVTYMQLLLDKVAAHSHASGAIEGAAYLAAALASLALPTVLARPMQRAGLWLSLVAGIGGAALLWALHRSTSSLQLGIMFTLYHSLAEVTLVTIRAEMSRLLASAPAAFPPLCRRVVALRQHAAPVTARATRTPWMTPCTTEVAAVHKADTPLLAAVHERELQLPPQELEAMEEEAAPASAGVSDADVAAAADVRTALVEEPAEAAGSPPSPLPPPRFGMVLGSNTALGIAVASGLQSITRNMPVRDAYAVYAVFMAGCCVVSLLGMHLSRCCDGRHKV